MKNPLAFFPSGKLVKIQVWLRRKDLYSSSMQTPTISTVGWVLFPHEYVAF
jgi:hypothetical protein